MGSRLQLAYQQPFDKNRLQERKNMTGKRRPDEQRRERGGREKYASQRTNCCQLTVLENVRRDGVETACKGAHWKADVLVWLLEEDRLGRKSSEHQVQTKTEKERLSR